MVADLLIGLARCNVAIAVAALGVLALRTPFRRLFGARIAYGLWAAVPFAALASVAPVRTAPEGGGYALTLPEGLLAFFRTPPHAEALLAAWAAGVLVFAVAVGLRQARFLRLARSGAAGPAVVGVIAPRIVAPRGYWEKFEAEERALIRAHERAHVERGDPRAIALMVALQALAWFNPLAHFAARRARQDQELACDATVVARLPQGPRRYAETLLKSHLVRLTPPLGCHWPPRRRLLLEERIRALGQSSPAGARRLAGLAAAAVATVSPGAGVWLARPPHPPQPAFSYRDPRAALVVDLTPAAPPPPMAERRS